MPYMNDVKVIGRVSSDPVSRHTKSGVHMVTFSFAIYGWGKDAKPDYIDVTLWKDKADFAMRYLQRGDQATIQGVLKRNEWEKDGEKRSKHIIDSAQICDFRKAKSNMTEYGEGGNTFTEVYNDVDENGDLPFNMGYASR